MMPPKKVPRTVENSTVIVDEDGDMATVSDDEKELGQFTQQVVRKEVKKVAVVKPVKPKSEQGSTSSDPDMLAMMKHEQHLSLLEGQNTKRRLEIFGKLLNK